MIKKIDLTGAPDSTYSSCVIAGDFIYTSHQGGGKNPDFNVQLENSFKNLIEALYAAGAALDDVVQINLILKNVSYFFQAEEIFRKYFKNGFPARTTITSDFVFPEILVQLDAVAYKKQDK